MLSSKNTSPAQIAALTALCIAVPVGVAFYLYDKNWLVALGSILIVFLGSMFLVRFMMDKFIYRKIKLIYKYIYQTKASHKEEMYYKYLIPAKSIAQVSDDVEVWAKQQEDAIATLQVNETYRKEFLLNLSHELRTPIFSIQGYVESLLDGALENPEMSKRFLENTNKNVARLVNLVNDLNVITKLESGEQPLLKENFIIQHLIRDTYESLLLKASNRHITMSLKKGCESPIEVFADKEKIAQVIMNVVMNAIKYGNNGGVIVAGVYNTDDRHILIEISDDGIGISEDHIPRVFERFYRTDDSRSRNIGGTGLGLAICKHIIEAHQQNIHVRSKQYVGTTVGFTLEAKR